MQSTSTYVANGTVRSSDDESHVLSIAGDLPKGIQRDAERLCEVINELDRLERLTDEAVAVVDIANALGWSATDLVEEVLSSAVEIGCAFVDASGGYRVG